MGLIMQVKIGQTFNNFTVISNGTPGENSSVYYQCVCVCGQKRNVRKGNLGEVIGCGCKRKQYKQRTKPPIKSALKTLKKTITARKKVDDILFERELQLHLF